MAKLELESVTIPMKLDFIEKSIRAIVHTENIIRGKDIEISELISQSATMESGYHEGLLSKTFDAYDLHNAYIAGLRRGYEPGIHENFGDFIGNNHGFEYWGG